ncbi:MAG: accessory factor UbiK family protein [Pseudomonadota bacterium]|nr:accessory factor UbiK family protein [Pseudomonadota bacterium]
MRGNQKMIDDLLALGGNVLGNLLGARHELRAQAKQRLGSIAERLDLVSRQEFDAAFAMLSKARAKQDEILERLEVIEANLNLSSRGKNKKAKKRRLPSVKQGNRARGRS